MNAECLICKAPLVYLEADEEMRCAICGKRLASKTRCVNGHFVCSACHMAGLDAIVSLCLSSGSKNPVEIIRSMMAQPFCHMHGPEHHVMVGAALLTAYKNAGGDIELEKALSEMMKRGKSVPGGACGFWGACGAGISSGMFVSIISSSTPPHGRALRPVASDDGEIPLRHRRDRRSALLQAGFLPFDRSCDRLCCRALRRADGKVGDRL